MITCNLMGGLGNQLFQIFTTIAIGIKTGNVFIFLNQEKLGVGTTTERPTYWNSLFKRLSIQPIDKFPKMNIIREKGFKYENIELSSIKNKDVLLYGYFQSYKYFIDEFNSIKKLIRIEDLKNNLIKNETVKLYNCHLNVSMHFRIGDYKQIQNCHPILNYSYYKNCLDSLFKRIKKSINILYFCEENDLGDVNIIITKLKIDFPDVLFQRCDDTFQDWEQMLIMSMCNHNIIANSSFSWWAAFLNNNSNKEIFYPSKWFGPDLTHDTGDLFPKKWTKILIE